MFFNYLFMDNSASWTKGKNGNLELVPPFSLPIPLILYKMDILSDGPTAVWLKESS